MYHAIRRFIVLDLCLSSCQCWAYVVLQMHNEKILLFLISTVTGHLSVSYTLMWTAGNSEISLNPRNMNTTTVTENFRLTILQKEMLPYLTLWQAHTLQRSSLWGLPRNKLGQRQEKVNLELVHLSLYTYLAMFLFMLNITRQKNQAHY